MNRTLSFGPVEPMPFGNPRLRRGGSVPGTHHQRCLVGRTPCLDRLRVRLEARVSRPGGPGQCRRGARCGL